jgi:hypothetical protein
MKNKLELLSIHIPKTAGTSFYNVLEQVYPVGLSPSLKRRDLANSNDKNSKSEIDLGQFKVVHGHITWQEAAQFCDKESTKIICWLRNPVDRVLSNYRFFINRLENPQLNPEVAEINLHRLHETPIEYAEREENRNRMSKFTAGLELEDFFFIGLVECFNQDLQYLAEILEWPPFTNPHLNQGLGNTEYTLEIREAVANLNEQDMDLYSRVISLKANHPKCLPQHE